SVRPSLGRLVLNVDVSSTAFYAAGPLLDSAAKFMNLRSPSQLTSLREADWRKLHKWAKGLPITVSHRSDGRTFKVKGITSRGADRTMFKLRQDDNTEIDMSVANYFTKNLNVRLNYPELPCVELKRGVMLPLEICQVASGHRYRRKLDENQTAEMIKFTCVKPSDRFNRIRKNAEQLLRFEANPYLKAFGIKVGRELLTVAGRVLPPPTVIYGATSREPTIRPRDGSWNMRDKRLVMGADLPSYGILVLDRQSEQNSRMVLDFMQQFNNNLRNMGIRVPSGRPQIEFGHPMQDMGSNLRKAWDSGRKAFGALPKIIYVVLGSTAAVIYGEVKRISDTQMGAPTQCMQIKHLRRPNIQYMANVALKVNVKLGGVNSYLEPRDTPFLAREPTMVIGADVTHPGPGNTTDPSIAAVICSMDSRMTKFKSQVSPLPPRTEIIANLEGTMAQMFQAFRNQTTQLPRRILFYRDGVSESQFQTVLTHELGAIKKAAASFYKNSVPVTFVTCQKRHHIRFMPAQANRADRSGNCPAGTVVDRDITHPKEFDFFLQAHGGLQGTSRPTHYTVLHDENKFTADSLQVLTNQMCYLFPRCTRSVSLCPPAYFADLLAFRARYHRH
ncbi:hypothetical protein H4R33_007142, partial [Dimargaris cristalligena]